MSGSFPREGLTWESNNVPVCLQSIPPHNLRSPRPPPHRANSQGPYCRMCARLGMGPSPSPIHASLAAENTEISPSPTAALTQRSSVATLWVCSLRRCAVCIPQHGSKVWTRRRSRNSEGKQRSKKDRALNRRVLKDNLQMVNSGELCRSFRQRKNAPGEMEARSQASESDLRSREDRRVNNITFETLICGQMHVLSWLQRREVKLWLGHYGGHVL